MLSKGKRLKRPSLSVEVFSLKKKINRLFYYALMYKLKENACLIVDQFKNTKIILFILLQRQFQL